MIEPHRRRPGHQLPEAVGEGIAAILARRIELAAEIPTPDLTSVFAEDAIPAIYAIYDEKTSVRRAIQVCHTALHEALDAGDSLLTAHHVVAANAD